MEYTFVLEFPGEGLISSDIKGALRTLHASKLITNYKHRKIVPTPADTGVNIDVEQVKNFLSCNHGEGEQEIEAAVLNIVHQVLFENGDFPNAVFLERKNKLLEYLNLHLQDPHPDLNKIFNLAVSVRDCIYTSTPLIKSLYQSE